MTRGSFFTACRTTARGWRLDRAACLWAVALLCLIFFGLSVASAADKLIQLPFDGGSAGLKRHALYRPDVAGDLPAGQLLAGDAGFMPYDPAWEEDAPPMWVKLKLRDTSSTQDSYVLLIKRRFFQRLDLYLPDGDGGHKHISTGLEDYHPTEIAGNEFVYRFGLGDDNRGTILLHVKTIQGNLAPLGLAIETPLHFEQQQAVSMWAYGLYFGAMLALIFYNLVLYINLRRPGHRLYVVAMSCMLVLMGLNSGLLQKYLPPVGGASGPFFILLFSLFTTAATTRFLQVFANTGRFAPGWHKTFSVSVWVTLVLAVVVCITPAVYYAHVAAPALLICLGVFILLLAGSVTVGIRGSSMGYLFAVAWSIYLLGVVFQSLISFDVMTRVPAAEYTLYLGSVLESMILALGLSFRVGQLRGQRDSALREQVRARRLANVDALTGTYNRRFLEAHLNDLLSRTGKRAFPGSLLLLDLDNFKTVNDKFGHPAGDQVLIQVCQRCKDTLRAEDILSRLGGDEFAIILPDQSGDDAIAAAQRIVENISGAPVIYDESEIMISVSVGLYTDFPPGTNSYDAFKTADQALYDAKRQGKNRVSVIHGGAQTKLRNASKSTEVFE